jgi:hypothetical protein
MRTHVRSLAAGTALAAALCFLAGPGEAQDGKAKFKAFLPAGAYKELVARSAKAIEANLAAPDEDKLKRAQVYAAFIAGAALSAPESPANVERAALELAQFVTDKGKVDQAKVMAKVLPKWPEGGRRGAKAQMDALGKYPEDISDLMDVFKTKGKGGEGIAPALQSNLRLKGALNGIEEKIRDLAKKKLTDAKVGNEAEELALLGYKTAVFGELTDLHTPPRKGKGAPKDWHELSERMRDAGVELAAAAAKKDADAIYKAASRLNTSCTECHSLFR